MRFIQYSCHGHTAYLTLDRPAKRNALTPEMVKTLHHYLIQAQQDEHIWAVVLRATGSVFCAGMDLNSLYDFQQKSLSDSLQDAEALKDMLYYLYRLQKVVIAEVQGDALAGGCALASVCDFVFAVPTARFGYPEVKIGFVPALATPFLIQKIGEGQARSLLLGGDLITASQAHALGLINHIVPLESLFGSVHEFLEQHVTTHSFKALVATKELLIQMSSISLPQALSKAAIVNAEARFTEECRTNIKSFINQANAN